MADGENNGWDFWDKVYTNRELRQQMDERAQSSEVSMSQLLRCSSLARAELLVLNVPRLAPSQERTVRDLVRKDLLVDVPILNVEIFNRKWLLRFYRREDASKVLRVLSNHEFKGKVLHVTLKEINTIVEVTAIAPDEVVQPEEERNPNWMTVEWNDIIAFRSELINLLKKHEDGLPMEDAVCTLKAMRRKGVISCALVFWPLGLFRILSPQVRMVGRYLSLPEQTNLSHLMRIAVAERVPRVTTEDWEPFAPQDIRSDAQLMEYLSALLRQFGPQHMEMSLALRILATTLGPTWPRTSGELVNRALELSPTFVLINDILFLAASIRHRRALLDYLVPATINKPVLPL